MKRILILLLAGCLLTGCKAPVEEAEPTTESTQATNKSTKATAPVKGTTATKPTKATTVTEPTKNTDATESTKATTPPAPAKSGWVTTDGKTYYKNADGSYAKGKVTINGLDYFFDKNGVQVLVVNPWYFVPQNYEPDLVTFYDFAQYADGNVLDSSCIDPLLKMLEDCQEAGHQVRIVSSYRRTETQQTLYNNKVDYFLEQGYTPEKAREEAGKIIAMPGTSEHQLGLAVDLIDKSYPYLDEGQENTAAQKWLMEHCWEYGFILRYPNGKTEHTGIIYEPWHYRYVGKELALEVKNSGLCLEEYFESLN